MKKTSDVVIIGGGLAGLCLSIQLAVSGYEVILLEKHEYPFHKVCGEYISMESWPFLTRLGLPLDQMNLPRINTVEISSPSGTLIKHRLDLGGFGISRYELDFRLSQLAKMSGVRLFENTRVTGVEFHGNEFNIKAGNEHFTGKLCAGSFGKRSNLDIKWNRPFIQKRHHGLNNYLGIKYHVRYPVEPGVIALHNFQNGYCGISSIENDKACLCYLSSAINLQHHDNDIKKMEAELLSKNPHLRKIFSEAEILFKEPEVISQISFEKKSLVENHVLMIGDAAGMITPLCGNGMSMAMHGSKIAASLMHQFLQGIYSRSEMESEYIKNWSKQFSSRMVMGRGVQSLFGDRFITNLFIGAIKPFPFLIDMLIKKTHGQPF
ncbi:NAD(P)/FAD-dependent oxidoreductase [Pollutibacter soli]|uniref:NAD(P)/FAD-dependent oxidoreductase n=1 Tax=Pollutibacter soli TaxID=3034157 RepID=UPI00301367C0